jgi:hypothetical protein
VTTYPKVRKHMVVRGPLSDGGASYVFSVRSVRRRIGGVLCRLEGVTEGVGGSDLNMSTEVFFPCGEVKPPFEAVE